MSAILILLLGIAGMLFGWFIYSRYVATYIFKLDPGFVTPANEINDGKDFVPTNKYVLWGHHFTSVAGAAPIVGPAIAAYWGWLPALVWVVFGSIFFAGIHDMGAMWASNRHKGQSMGALSASVIGKRTRSLYMVVVFLVLMMVNSVFAVVISKAFIDTPRSVFPAWAAIAVALVIGQLIYRKLLPLGLLAFIGVTILYYSIYVGANMPLALPAGIFNLDVQATWIIILFIYAVIASMLPVWALLQPRDFINGMQLTVGLFLLYGAVLIAGPEMTAPAINQDIAANSPSIIPILFVTIACGAVSGFHGIVASGTISKQLNKETDARFVGYLGGLAEGCLAMITLITVSSVAVALSPEEWHNLYSHFGAAGISAFVTGGANLIEEGWGISSQFSQAMLATMLVLFAGTTMDSGVRLQRYIIQEWGQIYKIDWLKNGIIATFIAVGCCLLIAFGTGGSSGAGGMAIWPLFGSTNQLLAAMTLLVLSVMLIKLKRPAKVVLIPMAFVLVVAFFASIILFLEFYQEGNYLLMAIDGLVMIVTVLVILDAIAIVVNTQHNKQPERE